MTAASRAGRATVSALVGLFLSWVLGGCPTPAQEGGLKGVDTVGFTNRMSILCRSGHADPSCPSPPDAAPGADSGPQGEEDAAPSPADAAFD